VIAKMTEDELTVIETAFLSYAERINSKKYQIYFMPGAFVLYSIHIPKVWRWFICPNLQISY